MKLHIGCGKCYIPGWLNLDISSLNKADLYCNAIAIPYPMESFDIIYASHVLEHFNRHTVRAVLTYWYSLLKRGGILRLSVPNFTAIVERYRSTGDLNELMGLLYGGQESLFNDHHIVFDKDSMAKFIGDAGFICYRDWDWKKTEHFMYDDYSQAYLPHMDKTFGLLMSLNIEAVK